MLSVTILGFSGAVQAGDTGNTSLVISDGTTVILVDTSGSPVHALLANGFNPASLDAVVLTHAHVDHIYALPSLIHNLWLLGREKPLIVMGNEETIRKAEELCKFFSLDKKEMMEIIWTSDISKIGDIGISAFPLYHRPLVPTDGFVFESRGGKVSYFPDNAATPPYPEEAIGSDIVIHEAGGVDSDRELLREKGHSSGYLAADVAAVLKAKRLVLVHLPADPGEREKILEEAKRRFSNSEIAERDKTY